MRARLDGIYSIDLPGGPPELPPDPEDCWLVVQADIGLEAGEAVDTFTFYVCTPKRLEKVLQVEPCQVGRHLLIVGRFDWAVVEASIRGLVDDLRGESWEELAAKIGRYGLWEFEDYVEAEEAR